LQTGRHTGSETTRKLAGQANMQTEGQKVMPTGWSAEWACWHRWVGRTSGRQISRQKGRKVY
jgi:hypothetical protein